MRKSLEKLQDGEIKQSFKWNKKATKCGIKIKINTVALQNFNQDHLLDMIEWCSDEGHDVTIIEVMPMGDIEVKTVFINIYLYQKSEKL